MQVMISIYVEEHGDLLEMNILPGHMLPLTMIIFQIL